MNNTITVTAVVHEHIQEVWNRFTTPEDIKAWMYASEDWHCPYVENDVVKDGRFLFRMSAKDGSTVFDVTGVYTSIKAPFELAYTMDDGRKAHVVFIETPKGTEVTETVETESINSEALQRAGWQAILDNFKAYVEKSKTE